MIFLIQVINISDLKRVQVSFTPQQWDLLKKLKGPMGNTNAEIVRNIVLAWLSEKSLISSSVYGKKGLQQEMNEVAHSTKLHGKVNARGDFNVGGKTEIEVLNVSGSARFKDDVNAIKITLNGTSEFGGNVTANQVKGSGTLTVQGKVSAESFSFAGSIVINDKLKAKKITLKVNQGTIQHMEGQIIKIKSKGGILQTNTIKGEIIDIESTKADLIQGQKVRVGPNCDIREIKAETLETHESSSVDTITKL